MLREILRAATTIMAVFSRVTGEVNGRDHLFIEIVES